MFMASVLLDRQRRLLEYLSSHEAIFGNHANVPIDPALQGIHQGVLRLQARFACNKRLEKIITAFPRTFEILGAERSSTLREFVAASPPTSKRSLANAREFHAFLSGRWRCSPSEPAYLPDVTACELAMAEVRNVVEDRENQEKKDRGDERKQGIRRRQSVVPLRCAYDIRSIFDAGPGEAVPPQRNTTLVVTLSRGSSNVGIVETDPIVVHILTLLDDWADPCVLDAFGDAKNLFNQLVAHEFIETRT
jgi:hypothetical protein